MEAFGIGFKLKIMEYRFLQNRHNDIKEGNSVHYIGRLKSGSVHLVSGDVELFLSAGDVFYIPKGVSYTSTWLVGDGCVVFDSFAFSEIPLLEGARFALQAVSCDAEMTALIDRIADGAVHERGAVGALDVSGAFLSLLSLMIPQLSTLCVDRQLALVARALARLRDDPQTDISTLAAALSVSESGLYAAFRRGGYDTPNEERQKILIALAVERLISTDRSVEEISAELGFSSSSYFRKVFSKVMGMPPREVRRGSVI